MALRLDSGNHLLNVPLGIEHKSRPQRSINLGHYPVELIRHRRGNGILVSFTVSAILASHLGASVARQGKGQLVVSLELRQIRAVIWRNTNYLKTGFLQGCVVVPELNGLSGACLGARLSEEEDDDAPGGLFAQRG